MSCGEDKTTSFLDINEKHIHKYKYTILFSEKKNANRNCNKLGFINVHFTYTDQNKETQHY